MALFCCLVLLRVLNSFLVPNSFVFQAVAKNIKLIILYLYFDGMHHVV